MRACRPPIPLIPQPPPRAGDAPAPRRGASRHEANRAARVVAPGQDMPPRSGRPRSTPLPCRDAGAGAGGRPPPGRRAPPRRQVIRRNPARIRRRAIIPRNSRSWNQAGSHVAQARTGTPQSADRGRGPSSPRFEFRDDFDAARWRAKGAARGCLGLIHSKAAAGLSRCGGGTCAALCCQARRAVNSARKSAAAIRIRWARGCRLNRGPAGSGTAPPPADRPRGRRRDRCSAGRCGSWKCARRFLS